MQTDAVKTPEPRRLYQHIADQIRTLIRDGEFPLGGRLPAERDLAQQLGVSRPSLREALIALEIDGTVEIRMGSGVYVMAEPDRRTGSMGESPLELIAARLAIEGVVVQMACARLAPDGLAGLRRILDAMRAEIDRRRKPLDHDRLFHVAIAEQSGNSVMARIVGDLFDERHSPISARLRARFEDRHTWAAALLEHEAIYAALAARDTILAQVAMHAHLEAAKRRWMENEPG